MTINELLELDFHSVKKEKIREEAIRDIKELPLQDFQGDSLDLTYYQTKIDEKIEELIKLRNDIFNEYRFYEEEKSYDDDVLKYASQREIERLENWFYY